MGGKGKARSKPTNVNAIKKTTAKTDYDDIRKA